MEVVVSSSCIRARGGDELDVFPSLAGSLERVYRRGGGLRWSARQRDE